MARCITFALQQQQQLFHASHGATRQCNAAPSWWHLPQARPPVPAAPLAVRGVAGGWQRWMIGGAGRPLLQTRRRRFARRHSNPVCVTAFASRLLYLIAPATNCGASESWSAWRPASARRPPRLRRSSRRARRPPSRSSSRQRRRQQATRCGRRCSSACSSWMRQVVGLACVCSQTEHACRSRPAGARRHDGVRWLLAVDERCKAIMDAADAAVAKLMQELKVQLIQLPKKVGLLVA